ncbi:hypothetical protein BDV10DRAFT_191788 [Aspergillus recurvatus]
MAYEDIQARSVGPQLARLLPNDGLPCLSLLCLFLLAASDSYDGTLMNGLQALPRWQAFMDSPTGAWLGFVNAVQNLSAFVLYPVVAWCSDQYGRKTTLASFTSGPALILMAETAYPIRRGIITAMFMCGWYVGFFLAAWATFGTRNAPGNWSWCIPSLLQCAIPILDLPGFLWPPRAPARAFLIKYHAGGDENSPLANFELQEIVKSLALETRYRKPSSWLKLLRTTEIATAPSSALHSVSLRSGLALGSSLTTLLPSPILRSIGITSVTNQTMISWFLQLWNLVLFIGAAFNVDRFGRRPLFLVSSIGLLCAYIVISGLSGSFAQTNIPLEGTAVIPFLFIYYGFYSIAFTPRLVSGLALDVNSTRVALFFNTFVNPIILDAIAWKHYIAYCVILSIISVTIWFWYPETKGHTLEEISKGMGESRVIAPAVEDKGAVSSTLHVEKS